MIQDPALELSTPPTLFASLPDPRPRTGAFGLGLLITSTILVVGCMVPLVARPAAVESATKYVFMELTVPPITTPDAPPVVAKIAPLTTTPAIEVRRSTARVLAEVAPVFPAIPALAPQLPQPKFVAPAHVQTNVFASTGSSAPPTTVVPRNKLQTGGFGDPNGVPPTAQGTEKKQLAIASTGSFDLPAGNGQGNGLAGSRGQPGTVSSAGFGNGTATSNPRTASHGQIQQSGFGDASLPAIAPLHTKPAAARLEPVEILSKPNPVYSDEARKRRIEGDVLVQVTFLASGEVGVVRVLSGLEQDLDSAAVQAARQIKFKPARRDGQPYDLTATVRIAFRLAY